MLTQFNKKFLFSSTVMAGLTAVIVAGAPAYAQTAGAQAPAGTPQTSDTTPATNAIVQQSPDQGAPEQVAPDPAVVDQPENPNEARNQSGEPVTDDEGEVEAVVVTGSRIRRDPTNAPAPLIQVGRQEVLQSGEPNIIDFLADIPALQTSIVPEDTTGSNLNDGGLSLLNLRNLGSERTLVLVDGRRHVGSGPADLRVDVDTIPSLLLENVEVVTGGQSALYGADAVSGVVNFILRRNFEGIEIDGALSQINQDGQLGRRISGLAGRNFLNDRLNVYLYGEYTKTDEVLDLDIDYRRASNILLGNDADPSPGQPDGVFDLVLARDVRNISRARGGALVFGSQVTPSPGSDPDIPFQTCPTIFLVGGGFRTAGIGNAISPNCTAFAPETGATFVFNADGSARPGNFGTFQQGVAISRPNTTGGDGLLLGAEFGQGSRLPESENYRFQTGLNFDITDNVMFFAEAKHVEETTFDSGQPTFFNIFLNPVPANGIPPLRGTTSFDIGNDNAFLPASIRDRLLTNTRPVFEDCPRVRVPGTTPATRGTLVCPATGRANPNFGRQVGTVLDPRATLTIFGPSRSQLNERELDRYVVGLRGDQDRLGFINNFSWEVGYTYGEVNNLNFERGVDVERFQFASDAVRDVNNVLGRGAGTIVCRVQLLTANGQTIPDRLAAFGIRPAGSRLSASSPQVQNCTPISLFGSDFRADANESGITGGGGRPGLTQAQSEYLQTEIFVTDRNEQEDLLAFASGEVLEGFLPGGPIGIALGYEYRKETTSGTGRDVTTGDRLLFLNTGADFPEVSYDVNELFAEVRVPLLQDLPFVDTLEVSGAYRQSDYSIESVGKVNTYSLQGLYRPNRDILFRATYGEATRIPTLGDLFDPGGQTFANGLVDPCDAVTLRNIPDAQVRDRQRQNCITLLGPGFDPDTTRIIYFSGVGGTASGSESLQQEDSRSYTASVSFTPRFIPRFSLVLDYYNIKITDLIATPPAQALLTGCVSGTSATLNQAACDQLTRTGAVPQPGASAFQLVDFRLQPLNFAAARTQGLDFTARYSLDTADFLPRDLGRIDYALRGNYLIRNEFFTNIQDPGDVTEFDASVGQPRVRFLSTLTLSPTDRLSLTWDWDYQTSQELLDSNVALQDPDNRDPELFETDSYSQHDFSLRFDVRDSLTLRAGVVNAFDNDPPFQLGSNTSADNFDLFGRRFYVGGALRLGAAADR